MPLSLQDRTYTSPVIEASGKSRADSLAVVDSTNQNRPSESSDNDKLSEQDLNKDSAAQEEEESYGFAHPAASRPQRIVWIPKDTLGLTEEEVNCCEEAGVRVSFVNAKIDETGKVGIDGGPPDLI